MPTSNTPCDREPCDFSSDDRVCDILDKAGVPRDGKWRTLVLYLRGLRDYSYLSEIQQCQLQGVLLDLLRKRDFSEAQYQDILRREREILVAPHEERLRAALRETVQMANEFKRLIQERQGDVKALEARSVQAIASGQDAEEIISMLQSTFREVLHLMEKDAANLDRLSRTDPLTGLNNRRAFDEVLARCVAGWRDNSVPLSLLMLDIDLFKRFNDEFGHRIGDQALITVATLIRKSISLHGGDGLEIFPCRYGGEEFAVILYGASALLVEELAADIRQRIERYDFVVRDINGDILRPDVRLSISVGMAEADSAWREAFGENLIDAADKALYFAKRTGRNRVAKLSPVNGEETFVTLSIGQSPDNS